MAQDLDFNKFVDVDNTVIKPSPQRVGNILTLDEQVAIIKAYEQQPMYKVARMFNCSREQIKKIITNRLAIMEFYEEQQMDLRQRIKFLGECVYECIQRLHYHAEVPITEELIRDKALEFLDVLRIPGFLPTNEWLNSFKATYNITLSNKKISIHTAPQNSLDIKDIMTYCTQVRASKPLSPKYKLNNIKNREHEAKRLRKLNFLQKALKEYVLRVKFHHKPMKLDTMSLCQVARDLNEILKVPDFEPTTEWIKRFRKQFESDECLANVKRPPLSIDLKDILSYCSRMQNKTNDNTITLTPKETALQICVMPKYPGISESGLKFQQNPIIYLDDQAEDQDFKPDIEEIHVEKPNIDQPPPLKIRRIESINNDLEQHCKIPANDQIQKAPLVTIRQIPKEPLQGQTKQTPKTIIQKELATSPKEMCSTDQPNSIKIKEETLEDNYILPTNTIVTVTSPTQQLKKQQVHQLVSPTSPSTVQQHHQSQHPPPTLSPAAEDHDSEELPRYVTCFKDVLLLLKPLEEYAMLKENYRAIGLITQLEEVLKNEPESNMGDDEFIG